MEIFIGIYIMFSLGVGLAYGVKEVGFFNRIFVFLLITLVAPLAIGYDVTRKIIK